jgi:hypothetical protein
LAVVVKIAEVVSDEMQSATTWAPNYHDSLSVSNFAEGFGAAAAALLAGVDYSQLNHMEKKKKKKYIDQRGQRERKRQKGVKPSGS